LDLKSLSLSNINFAGIPCAANTFRMNTYANSSAFIVNSVGMK